MTRFQYLVLCILIGCQPQEERALYRNYIGSWSPDGRRVLFYSDRNGNWDILTIMADGTGLSEVLSSEANETEPAWHPVSGEFVYASDQEGRRKIYSYNFNTGKSTKLIELPGSLSSPVWSTDGIHLALLSKENEQWALIVLDTSDSSLTYVYKGTTYPGRPSWSPSESEVVYSISVNGEETLHWANIKDGTVKKFLTAYNSCGNAAMSPDGKQIVFDAHAEDVLESGDGKWEIFLMETSDQSVVRLTHNDRDDWGARWSPDGSKILFLGGGLNNTGYELFVMNRDGTGRLQLTDKRKWKKAGA